MNRKLVLLMSFALAVAAIILLNIWKSQLREELGVGGDTVAVLVAATQIPAYTVIDRDHLTVRAYPQNFVPPRAMTREFYDSVIGQTAQYTIPEGQAILHTDLTGLDTSTTLSKVVPPGFRALALPVDSVSTFGGLLQPKDHVDVLGTFNRPSDNRVETITILQNVVVLAVGNQLGTQQEQEVRQTRTSVVTVLVTAEEAELLIFAQDRGKLSMTMRSVEDVSTELELPGKNFDALFEPEVRVKIQRRRNTTPTGPTIILPGQR